MGSPIYICISKYIQIYIFFPSSASTLFFSAHTFGILMSDLYIRHIYMKWLQMIIQMVLICWQDIQNVEVFITDSIKRNIATEFEIKMFCDSSDNRFILIWSDIDVCWWNCISFLTWWKHVHHEYTYMDYFFVIVDVTFLGIPIPPLSSSDS